MPEDKNMDMFSSLLKEVGGLYSIILAYDNSRACESSLNVARAARSVANIAREIAGHNIAICNSHDSASRDNFKTVDISSRNDKVHSISTDKSLYVYEIVEHIPMAMNIAYLSYWIKDELGHKRIVSKEEFMNTMSRDDPLLRSITDSIILSICESYKDEVTG